MLLSISSKLENTRLLADLGYEALDVDFSSTIIGGSRHDPMLDGDNWEQLVEEAGAECRQLGILPRTCHLPFTYRYSDPKDENYDHYHKMACRSLQACEILGVRWAVMHIDKYNKEPALFIPETVAYAKKLFADSGVTKTGIAIENSTSMRDISDIMRIHDILKEEGYDVCYCLDVGHAHLNRKYDNHTPTVIHQLGDRLQMLHLHDNCRNQDLHAVPFAGTLPWEEIMVALKETGYAGDFNLEIDFDRVPKALLKPYLQYSAQVSRYLMSVFHNA